MFGALKQKLAGWFKKSKSSEETKEKPKTKKIKVKAPKEEKFPKIKKAKEIKESEEEIHKDISKDEEEIQNLNESIETTKDQIKGGVGEQIALDKKELKSKSNLGEGHLSETQTPEPLEKKSSFSFFRKKLTEEKFEELFQELELILLQNNVALEVIEKIKTDLREHLIGKNLTDVNLQEKLKQSLQEILINPPDFIKEIKKTLTQKQPFVIIFLGINGSGKTTTIAKVASLLKKEKLTCCLAAADTFRAASIEQIQEHANKLNLHLIKKDYGADPASVGFDAIQYAKKHHIDVVLIDTAGRMQNKDSLMRELEKITRVNKADMRIFVGESITGNDATEQAKAFNDLTNLTGIILSKADVDEKGGTALSVSHITKKPILFLGTGQSYDDLEVFDKDKVLKGLGL